MTYHGPIHNPYDPKCRFWHKYVVVQENAICPVCNPEAFYGEQDSKAEPIVIPLHGRHKVAAALLVFGFPVAIAFWAVVWFGTFITALFGGH